MARRAFRGPAGVYANEPGFDAGNPFSGLSSGRGLDPWQNLRSAGPMPQTAVEPSGGLASRRLTAPRKPIGREGSIFNVLTGGLDYDQRAAEFGAQAQNDAITTLQQEIAAGTPPGQAILKFMQSPQGMDYFAAGNDMADLVNIGKLAAPDPAEQIAASRQEAFHSSGDLLKAAGVLAERGDDEGARLALDMAAEARQREAAAKPATTDDLNEYRFYADQEKAAGRKPMSFYEYTVSQKQAGRATTNVTVGDQNLTPGWKKIDETFAADWLQWRQGGSADTSKQISQLSEAMTILESNPLATGARGVFPEAVQPFLNPEGTIAKEAVEEVVQRSLKSILGSQFTEKEGERLIARAYNPKLSTAENGKRIKRLLTYLQATADAKNDMAEYFAQNGTLRGYQPKEVAPLDLPPVSNDGWQDTGIDGVRIRRKD